MMKFIPYISFNGQCEEAVTFYEKVFQVKNNGITRYGDIGIPEYDIAKNLIMYTDIELEGNKIMLCDSFPGQPVTSGNQVSIMIVSKDVERITSIYHALSENGEVIMELEETFWSPAYGMVSDKFGITWQISAEAEEA